MRKACSRGSHLSVHYVQCVSVLLQWLVGAGVSANGLADFVRQIESKYGTSAGVVTRGGAQVYTWGNYTERTRWASASKPIFASLMLAAIADGKLASVDTPLRDLGWPLSGKDNGSHPMTWKHVSNMISGYTRVEAPGVAWAYNDLAIELFKDSLEKLYGQSVNASFQQRLAPHMQFEDAPYMDEKGWFVCSPRDFARLGWMWLNLGKWLNGTTVLPQDDLRKYMRPSVLSSTPVSNGADPRGDYLKIGTYGGTSSQSRHGPGVYGYTWWFNPSKQAWPSAPADAFQCNGEHDDNCFCAMAVQQT